MMKVKLKHVSTEHLDLCTWCKKATCHRWLASWQTYRIHGTRVAPVETNQMGFTTNKWKKSQDFTCIFWTALVNFHYTWCPLRQTRKASGRTHSDAVLVYSILLILISHFSYSFCILLACEYEYCFLEASQEYRILNSMNYIQVARQEKTCISRLAWANVNNVGADNIIGLTSLQLQFLSPEYTDAHVHWCPPASPSPHTWLFQWEPRSCAGDDLFHFLEPRIWAGGFLTSSLSFSPPSPPRPGCLLRWSKKIQANSHRVYSIDVKEKNRVQLRRSGGYCVC